MSISPFVFSSDKLPKLKAKQLSKTFPFLRLARAQEATARALGYASWYDCSQRGQLGELSLSDQDAGMDVRTQRYYHQANVLMSLGIAPNEADRWVRAWGLTGSPTLNPEKAIPFYYLWDRAITSLEVGEMTEEEFCEAWGDGGYSKYPEFDRPERYSPGVIIGPAGKYPHFVVHPVINSKIPPYVRGPNSAYHIEDSIQTLSTFVKGFPREKNSNDLALMKNPIHYEWHFGKKHPGVDGVLIPGLIEQALEAPESFVIISIRMTMKTGLNVDYSLDKRDVACLRGKDFASFLLNKGVLNPDAVVWFSGVDSSVIDQYDIHDLAFYPWLRHSDSRNFNHPLRTSVPLPLFADANKYKKSLPVYSYPFKSAPMSREEYGISEIYSLLPLNQDYEPDEIEDDSEDSTCLSEEDFIEAMRLTHLTAVEKVMNKKTE